MAGQVPSFERDEYIKDEDGGLFTEEDGWPKDPDGELRLDTFTVDAMTWLKEYDHEYFLRALKANMKYLTTKGFVPYDLQREILDYTEKKQYEFHKAKNENSHSCQENDPGNL